MEEKNKEQTTSDASFSRWVFLAFGLVAFIFAGYLWVDSLGWSIVLIVFGIFIISRVITVRIRFSDDDEDEEDNEDEEEFYEENESTNLYHTLSQSGHSGVIEGLCRVHYPEEYTSPENFFESDSSPNEVQVTFSAGTKPLGTYTFVAVSFIGGHLVLQNTKDEIHVDIEAEDDNIMDFCRFRAVLHEKS